ncbi:hypothetical protein JTB14_027538 [Gonioctena quinquepunctata]|nr:hypothetical protein JTB14_027538 [Gonioctena quinquepunctata]
MSGTGQRPRTPDRGTKPPININSATEFTILSPDSPETDANTSQLSEMPTFSGVLTRSRANSNSSIHSNLSTRSQAPTTSKSNDKNVENQPKSQDSPTLTELFNIRNLPDNMKFQAEVYDLLVRSDVLGGNLENIKVNPNRTALIETIDPIDIDKIRKKIRHIGGCPKIEIRDLRNHRERLAISTKEPSMSFVIGDVDENLTNEANAKHFRDTGVEFEKLWRIISRARQEPTKMVRVITHSAETYSRKLAYGIHIYGLKHKCEKSNTPSALLLIKYCSRCCKSGTTSPNAEEI